MSISVGDKIPAATVTTMTDEGPQPVNSEDFFSGRKVVMFGVPGAFTPTCHNQHLPGFVRHLDAIKAKGVDEIACISVNDAAVMKAWGEAHGAPGKVSMLSDGIAEFAQGIGLSTDMSARGYGVRSKRYAMVIANNVVEEISVEPSGEYGISSAEAVLERLG